MADQRTPGFPLADFLGMLIEQPEQGTAVARVEVTAEHLNPHGSVHGAVLFAMVDTAMGAATMSVLGHGQLCASIDVQVRFCKPASEGGLVAAATVMQAGKRIVHLQADVRDQHDALVALASGSFAVLGPVSDG